ncbi:MAG: CheR family methyltransferase, partial [Planctomycetota bacterium]
DLNAFDKLIGLLRSHTGHDFSLYKKSTIFRRVERRMGIHQIDKIHQYISYLQKNSQEADLLFKELLIGVTSFFRDAAAWNHLRDHTLPELLKRHPTSREFRAWTPGCSTGEEAYSLAIVFREVQESLTPHRHCRLQIFATDLDPEAIDKARQGIYPANIAADVSPERLARFFVKEGDGYRVVTEIRETMVFAPQNVIMDPPFTKIDILVCRNLLIYLEGDLQKTLLPLFHHSLRPGGILFLGSAETIGGFTNLFGKEEEKLRIYHRLGGATRYELTMFPSSFVPASTNADDSSAHAIPSVDLQTLAAQVILRHHAPPAVLTTDAGDVVYISRQTGKYLEPAVGKANLNIFAMARKGLREELGSTFRKAIRKHGTIMAKGLRINTDHGEETTDIIVQVLDEPLELRDMVLIVFRDAPATPKHEKSSLPAVADGEYVLELERVRNELYSVREENQAAQEELHSANEELQSTNEELQSTNEELITSKEEMQSMNEELQTVNAEMQAKVDELSVAASDVRNLLDSTDIATIFLDADLHVRRFTSRATEIIKFIPGDVGRPITDLASSLDYPDLADDALEVLRTLIFSEKKIPAHTGRWFSVRIMPYRTIDDRIDGVVITLVDIPEHRQETKTPTN